MFFAKKGVNCFLWTSRFVWIFALFVTLNQTPFWWTFKGAAWPYIVTFRDNGMGWYIRMYRRPWWLQKRFVEKVSRFDDLCSERQHIEKRRAMARRWIRVNNNWVHSREAATMRACHIFEVAIKNHPRNGIKMEIGIVRAAQKMRRKQKLQWFFGAL